MLLKNEREDLLENSRGEVYYGLHFYPGVAEYHPPDGNPFRVLINETTIREMGPSMEGIPVYVQHREDVPIKLDEVRESADGFVVETFFNEADGKHWCKFIICSEAGREAVRRKMKLSNAYRVTRKGNGGTWNGVQYQNEVLDGRYHHLALVHNPRYVESDILTPDEFKAYNEQRRADLTRLSNNTDQEESGPMGKKFTFFKREAIKDGIDLESTMVELPKSKREVPLSVLVNEMDDVEVLKNAKDVMANGDHLVKVGDEKMTVNELIKKHGELCNELKRKDDEEEEDEIKNEADDEQEEKDEEEEKLQNEEEQRLENEAKEKREKGRKAALRLKNANDRAPKLAPVTVITSSDQVARGKARY